MAMCGGVEIWLHGFLTSILDASCQLNAPAALLPSKETRLLIVGPQKHSAQHVSLLGIEYRLLGRPSSSLTIVRLFVYEWWQGRSL
jgi:hypothetical protein